MTSFNALRPNAPIGVFDSGVGGLSVLQALRAALPGEDIIYLADSAHAPYGERSHEFIEQRTVAIGLYLLFDRLMDVPLPLGLLDVLEN